MARRLGYAGALVPGVEVFALASAPLVARWGEAFLASGGLALRFHKPVYDKERVRVAADDGALTVTGPDQVVRARGSFTPPAGRDPVAAYEDAPLPAEPAPAPALGAFGSIELPPDPAACADYVRRIGEPSPLYATWLHPGLLLRLVNLALMRNVGLGPWIHTASDCRFHGLAGVDEPLAVRSRVRELFARHGHSYVRYDALVLAAGRPVAEVEHEAIWRVAGT